MRPACALAEHRDGLHPRVAQGLEPRQFHDAPERVQIEEPGHAVEVLVIEAGEAGEQRRQDAARAAVDLEAHDVALPAAPQLLLEGFDVRLPAFVVQLQLGVAREAERGRLEDDLPGEQRVEAGANHVVEHDEGDAVAAGDAHEARQAGGHLHDRDAIRAALPRRAPAGGPG